MKKIAGMPSGPGPVEDFNFRIILRMASSLISMSDIPGSSG